MLRRRVMAGLILSVAVAPALGAQGIGGMIKRKAAEAVKPKNEPVEKAKENSSAEPRSPFPFEYTPEVMAAFKRGLELEIRMRDDYRKELARLKTPDEYKACTNKAMASPDAMKMMEEYMGRADKVKTAEDGQRLIEWQNQQVNGILLKQCGPDPQPLVSKQTERFTKAQYDGAMEFAKSWAKPPSRENPMGNREQDGDCFGYGYLEDGGAPDSFGCEAEVSVQEAPDASTDERVLEYLRLKELVEKYCSLSPEMRADAEKNGIRVPGTGKDIYWVFSRGFAIWVGPDCDHLKKLFSIVTSK